MSLHLKLDQIARLRDMLKKWRRQAPKKAHSLSDMTANLGGESIRPRRTMSTPTVTGADNSSSGSRRAGRVPAGHLAVYVGEERRRFVIKMCYLSHPLFKELLKKTEEEIGFRHEGALVLLCEVACFEQLLRIMQSCKAAHHRHTYLADNRMAANDEQNEELLQQLSEFSDLPSYTRSAVSHPLCYRSQSLSASSKAPDLPSYSRSAVSHPLCYRSHSHSSSSDGGASHAVFV